MPQRRRGRALEEALLDAAWAELTERGYDDMTIDAVAVRAGTSRAVLYRRWPDKQELVLAALLYEAAKDMVVAPDTGSLRGDVIALLQAGQQSPGRAWYRSCSPSSAASTARPAPAWPTSARSCRAAETLSWRQAIQRAIDRGEIEPQRVTERIARPARGPVPATRSS